MNIAINGFGRIGRTIARVALDRGINIVAINDLAGADAAAYLFKYDSVYGMHTDKIEAKDGILMIGKKKIRVFTEKEPDKLPWKDLKVDAVVESTGIFTHREGASKHLQAGAKRVVISAPAKEPDLTIVPGVNHNLLKKEHQILSVGSCTTNCTAPIAKVLLDAFGIENAMLTTVHAYTNDQVIQDAFHKSPRRGRAGALNIIPTTTGAAEAVIEVIPELKGKMTGLSVRVPVPVGSLIDLTIETPNNVTIEEVNEVLKKAASTTHKGIIQYTTDPIVSSDIVGNPYSAIVDSLSTQATGNLIKVLAWYDNEFGYSNRLVDTLLMLK